MILNSLHQKGNFIAGVEPGASVEQVLEILQKPGFTIEAITLFDEARQRQMWTKQGKLYLNEESILKPGKFAHGSLWEIFTLEDRISDFKAIRKAAKTVSG